MNSEYEIFLIGVKELEETIRNSEETIKRADRFVDAALERYHDTNKTNRIKIEGLMKTVLDGKKEVETHLAICKDRLEKAYKIKEEFKNGQD